MKKLYGIGTGPGDKELLTLKAVKTIEKSSVIFAPKNKGKNMAIDTAKDFIGDKKVIFIDFPMGQVQKEDYKKAAETIFKEIPEGEIGSFLTIGDPMIYSTFIYIMEELEGKDIDVEIISGIPSFVAAAGESKTPITVKGESFLLCDELDESLLEKIDSIAILKTLKDKESILKSLEEKDFSYKYIKRATLEEQEVIMDKEEILKDKDYISLIIGRRN
ncbi:precorrin-2 C(20)-methyltransferase [Tissierella sp. MB52-C2]|uniref:precorrin-2 C(20)-methyltransferase n=1 Tax=Tissierella sp. MB52-C2 TaxID=3070999 RepID=UPI00280B6333|nr:precorrin-2 C(20)-methyltransferase [Tissierella sp. MB52-C2]WMM25860.1 precorrin-2 C(20)-methyltransferase [Tissierella sp. MB52-C2]